MTDADPGAKQDHKEYQISFGWLLTTLVSDVEVHMPGLFQMMVVLLVFGPLLLITLIWHIVWNNKSGPSSDPPPDGGPRRPPVPPLPRLSGDRTTRRPRPHRSRPRWPQLTRIA